VDVQYDAPKGCGSEAEVDQKLRAALGDEAVPEVPIRATVVVEPHGTSYLLRFHAVREGEHSERELEVDDCDAATEAAAVLLLLTIDPLLVERLGLREPASTATPEPPPEAEQPQEPKHAAEPHEPPPKDEHPPPRVTTPPLPLGGFLGVALVVSGGSTPTLGLGPELHAGLDLGAFETAAAVQFVPLGSAPIEQVSGATMTGSLGAVRVFLRARIDEGAFSLGPSLGLGVDRLALAANGVSDPGSGATQWASVWGGGFARFRLSPRWAAGLDAGAVFPLERPTYSVSGVGPVHRPEGGFEVLVGGCWLWGSQSAGPSATE
jgi:hypothetical protein